MYVRFGDAGCVYLKSFESAGNRKLMQNGNNQGSQTRWLVGAFVFCIVPRIISVSDKSTKHHLFMASPSMAASQERRLVRIRMGIVVEVSRLTVLGCWHRRDGFILAVKMEAFDQKLAHSNGLLTHNDPVTETSVRKCVQFHHIRPWLLFIQGFVFPGPWINVPHESKCFFHAPSCIRTTEHARIEIIFPLFKLSHWLLWLC